MAKNQSRVPELIIGAGIAWIVWNALDFSFSLKPKGTPNEIQDSGGATQVPTNNPSNQNEGNAASMAVYQVPPEVFSEGLDMVQVNNLAQILDALTLQTMTDRIAELAVTANSVQHAGPFYQEFVLDYGIFWHGNFLDLLEVVKWFNFSAPNEVTLTANPNGEVNLGGVVYQLTEDTDGFVKIDEQYLKLQDDLILFQQDPLNPDALRVRWGLDVSNPLPVYLDVALQMMLEEAYVNYTIDSEFTP